MRRLLLVFFIAFASPGWAQGRLDAIIAAEAAAGHFNGTVLVAKNDQILAQKHSGYANFQFAVPMADTTRLPIASMTKLFTAILALQLYEKGALRLDDAVATFVTDLPADCQLITIRQLLTHHSGLKNEPLDAYRIPYPPVEFVKKFVARKEGLSTATFNYNNVDYILLTRVLEAVTKKNYGELLQANILNPAGMAKSGMVREERIIPGLAYGYHNYSFGTGKPHAPLRNDSPIYLSNYAGAGAIYATAGDLFKLVQALRQHKLLTAKTTALLTASQQGGFVEYARGYPTLGFYYNDKTFSKPVLERRGSINGFNSVLLTDPTFSQVVILLTNTDTGDLELIGDQLYAEIK
jgi:CubicO group peptidase (beta-lactamase class C family)